MTTPSVRAEFDRLSATRDYPVSGYSERSPNVPAVWGTVAQWALVIVLLIFVLHTW